MKPIKQPSGRWKASVRTAVGRGAPRIYRTFDTRMEASRWQTEMRAQVQRGSWSAPDDSVTFKEFTDEWVKKIKVEETTRQGYRYHLKRLSALDDYRLGQLRRPLMEQVLADLTGAAGYRAQTHRVLAIVMKAAVAQERIVANPMVGIKPPPTIRKEVRVLTPAQVRRLLLAVRPHERVMLMTVAGTGLRQGEAFGLRKRRIEFLRRVLAVEEQIVNGKPSSRLKTEASRRRVPIPDQLLDELSAYVADLDDDDLLFTRPKGTPWTRSSFNATVWKPALRHAGLDETLGMHMLRHTYASHLIAHGLHPRVIQARLGHASISETMDTYGHLFPDSDEATRTAADRLFLAHGDSVGTPAEDAQGL